MRIFVLCKNQQYLKMRMRAMNLQAEVSGDTSLPFTVTSNIVMEAGDHVV